MREEERERGGRERERRKAWERMAR